jgi:hypothetical protein
MTAQYICFRVSVIYIRYATVNAIAGDHAFFNMDSDHGWTHMLLFINPSNSLTVNDMNSSE